MFTYFCMLTCTWLYIGLEQWFSTLAVTLGSPGNFKNSWCLFCSLDQLNQNLRMGPKPPYFLNRSFYFAGKIENQSTGWFLMGRKTNIYGVVCFCFCFFFFFCILLMPKPLKVKLVLALWKSISSNSNTNPKYWEYHLKNNKYPK